jgi:hypothetical protein
MQRRTVLQMLAALPGAKAAELHQHDAVVETASPGPRYFSARAYRLLGALSELIVPGAKDAGAPGFIDLLASENTEYQRRLSGGMLWLDAACAKRFDAAFLDCIAEQQRAVLDLIAFRANGVNDPLLIPGIQFFAFLRDLVLDGFFTSRAGIDYLEFRGNAPLKSFPGCPE